MLAMSSAPSDRRRVQPEEAHPAVARGELSPRSASKWNSARLPPSSASSSRSLARQSARSARCLSDIAAHATVADEVVVIAEARLAGDDVHLPRAALVDARNLQVEEGLARGEALEVRTERRGLDLDSRISQIRLP